MVIKIHYINRNFKGKTCLLLYRHFDFQQGISYIFLCSISSQGDRISLDRQLGHHNSTISRLSLVHQNITFLNECIYLVNIGSNDYINNYLMSEHYNSSRVYKADEYAEALMQQFSQQLKVFSLLHMSSF